MSSEKSSALKHIEENYRLIPMSDITDEARELAVKWVEGYKPEGVINLEQKHKLASDIMNYAEFHAKEFMKFADRKASREGLDSWVVKSGHNYTLYTTDQLYELYLKSLTK